MIIINPFQKNPDSIEKRATFPEYDFKDIFLIEQNFLGPKFAVGGEGFGEKTWCINHMKPCFEPC